MRRLTITLLCVALVTIFGLGLILDSLFENYQNEPADEQSELQAFGHGLASTLNSLSEPSEIVDHWPVDSLYTLNFEEPADLPLPDSLQQSFESGEPLALESDNGVSLHYFLDQHQQVLSLEAKTRTTADSGRLAFLFTAVFYIGTLLLLLLWLKPLLYRLNLLRTTTKRFGEGNLESRVQRVNLSYIDDIESDFNRMADKIQSLVDDNKLLTSAVSHDLRTPLARLRFGLDTVTETDSVKARSQYLKRMSIDLDHMEQQVNALLRYAKLDNVLEGMKSEPVSLRALLRECVDSWHDARVLIRVDDSNLTEDDDLVVNGCIDHLATLLNNLIDNAVAHADKRLNIELFRGVDNIQIAFCDDGAGIPEVLRTNILKPFQRGDSTRGDGYGLGLAVVSRISQHHGATVLVDDCGRLGGARISVVFQV